MIKILMITFLSLSALAVEGPIPMKPFDQSKLESLLRQIPAALIKTEAKENMVRKFFSYPKYDDKGFKIECQGDYYFSSELPSVSSCLVTLTENDFGKDEVEIEITDTAIVNNLYRSIGHGQEIKKFYSNEKLKGTAVDGRYGEIFRYAFICKKDACTVTFATKINPDVDDGIKRR